MRKRLAVGLALISAWGSSHADEAAVEQRRQRLDRERAAIEARYREDQARCASRFAVTACADDAKAQRRKALEPLERELASMDDEERRRRAADRLQRIDEKRRESARRPAQDVEIRHGGAVLALPKAPPRAGRVHPPRNAAEPPRPRPGASQAYEQRLQDAQDHRNRVKRRNEERAAQRPPAAPLSDLPEREAP